MADPAPTLTSVEQYLRSEYQPDREYIDGEVRERHLGEREHAAVQAALVVWFHRHRHDWNIRVYPELRVQVSPTRYRVPDVCVLDRSLPREPIITHPPLICIEILSPEDTMARTLERVADYRGFGVANIWIVDPETEKGYDCQPDSLLSATVFRAGPVSLDLRTLFADLD